MARIIKIAFKSLVWIISPFFVLAIIFYYISQPAPDPGWGLNFSIDYAKYLGLDARELWKDMHEEMKADRYRVMVYWESIEPKRGGFDFTEIDYFLEDAGRRGSEIILVLGHKQPRWPECHHPAWYENLAQAEKSQALLAMLETSVNHFKEFDSVKAWQIENEPFFEFGPNCPKVDPGLVAQEVEVVKNLDNRPIVLTDSGEKGAWLPTAWAGADIFGSTMYRKIYHHEKEKYIQYFVPSALYRVKAGMVRVLSSADKIIGVELQAEPWFTDEVYKVPWQKQKELMNPQIFSEYVNYARKVGFEENYLWGTEWWYWARKQGHPEMWQAAVDLFNE